MQAKLKIYWRNHTLSGNFVRVWRGDWAGDVFDVHSVDSFTMMQAMFRDVVDFIEAED